MSSQSGPPSSSFAGPPLYHQIARTLESRVYHGLYRPGAAIPSEAGLAREFGVTRLTVRQALQLLVDNGVLVPRQGSGTYVVDNPEMVRPINFLGFLEDGSLRRLSRDTALVRAAVIPAPDDVAAHLQLAPGTPVQLIERLRSFKGTPASLTVNYMLVAVGQQLPIEQLAEWSLTDLVREYAHVPVLSAHQILTAEGAPAEVAEALHVPIGEPLLRCEFLLGDGQTIWNYAVVHHRPQFTFYTATLLSLRSTALPPIRGTAPRPR